MLQARSRDHIYWVHTIWIVNLFTYMVVAWWVFYRWRNQQPWTFYLFVFVLVAPTVLYLASMLLFPRESSAEQSINYKTHFYSNHRAFFIIFGLYGPVDLLDSLLKGVGHLAELGPFYVGSLIAYVVGMAVAAITRNERFHQFYAIFFLIQTVTISFTVFRTLI